jgi:hypothetical protein
MAKCNECALHALKNGVCPIFNADMTDQEGCPMYMAEMVQCDICGNAMVGEITYEQDKDGNWHRLCGRCLQTPKCQSCKNTYCAFFEDTSCPEPQMTTITKQKGNMVIQTQQPNPARIDATCRKVGCACLHDDGDNSYCIKHSNIGGCNKYQTNWRN